MALPYCASPVCLFLKDVYRWPRPTLSASDLAPAATCKFANGSAASAGTVW